MSIRRHVAFQSIGVILAGAVLGCSRGPAQVGQAELPVIPVSQPVQREVTDYVDYTGRTDAVQSVGIRARVTGYLKSVTFKEGAEVREGDLLFEIDPRPYDAQLAQAQSQVVLNKASLKLAQTTYNRDKPLVLTGAVSQQQLDQDLAAVEEAQARLEASQASVAVFKLNVEFTKVTAPITGRISRYYFTPGNLIVQDQTLLTTLVSVNPMYAYFDMDEPTMLRIARAINAGKIQLPRESADVPVFMGLQGEEGHPHQGKVDFANNVVNPSTGTIAVRGVFPNPRPGQGDETANWWLQTVAAQAVAPAGPPFGSLAQQLSAFGLWRSNALVRGARLLVPGMFVRIRFPIGQPHPALLVIDRAVGSDQGLKFVYIVNKENKVEYRRVTTGPLQDDGLRVIEDGLRPDDWVVTGAVQQVRPRLEVSPEEMAMPSLSAESQAPSPTSKKPQPPPPGEKAEGRKQ